MPFHDPIAILGGLIGLGGGWRDVWDGPDDHAELRAHAEASEQLPEATAARIGRRWQREVATETPARSTRRSSRPG